MSLPLAQQELYLLPKEAGSQGVQDGVQGTVDRQDEDYHPRRDGSFEGNGVNKEKSIAQKGMFHIVMTIS